MELTETAATKQWRGWTFPAGETHLIEWMAAKRDIRRGRPTYQANKYDSALAHTRKRRLAVDIGANIGLWSWLMAHDFEQLHAFEPVPAFVDCWIQNVQCMNARIHPFALGEKPGLATMVNVTPGSCGDTTVDAGQGGKVVGTQVEMRTLDSYCFNDVDLIKCDNEGYELFVMRGAAKTIQRCRPCVIVEQKRGHGKAFNEADDAAVRFLETLGMQIQNVIAGDYIMTF